MTYSLPAWRPPDGDSVVALLGMLAGNTHGAVLVELASICVSVCERENVYVCDCCVLFFTIFGATSPCRPIVVQDAIECISVGCCWEVLCDVCVCVFRVCVLCLQDCGQHQRQEGVVGEQHDQFSGFLHRPYTQIRRPFRSFPWQWKSHQKIERRRKQVFGRSEDRKIVKKKELSTHSANKRNKRLSGYSPFLLVQHVATSSSSSPSSSSSSSSGSRLSRSIPVGRSFRCIFHPRWT